MLFLVFLKITRLKLSFENDIAPVLLLAFAVLAIGFSLIVYYKNRENAEFSTSQKRLLAILRATGLFLCLLLFLKPIVISRKQVKEKPMIIVAVDNSQSLAKFGNQVTETVEKIKNGLSDKYELDHWLFGEGATSTEVDTMNFTGNKSDYSELLASVSNQYINKNIGALIILGDGIYNAGQNPLNHLNTLDFPIYTIGFGDTVSIPDVRITDIKHNKSVFINNYFTIEADIHFEKLINQTARLELSLDNKVIETKTFAIPGNNYFVTEKFSIQATHKGLQNYTLKIIPAETEANMANNSYEFVIDVIDTKHKILVLSDGPHPDIGAMKEILESFSNFEVTLVNGNTIPQNINDFDLFVLYQLPSVQNENSKALQLIVNSKKPLLFVVGGTTSLPQLNNLQLGISSLSAKGLNESQIAYNKDFSLFKIENEYVENIENFPPLYVPYTEFKINSDFQMLGRQKIKGVNTNNPLVVLGNLNGRKISYILGEGIWRWRIHDFSMNRQYKTINEFVYKIFNYLVLKENDENFKLVYSTVYSENEEIVIGAELYNDSYEPINSPDVSLVLQKDSISEFRYTLDKIENKYSLNLGKPEAGMYRMEAIVKLGDKEYSKSGNFRVVRLNLEEQQTVANHQFLYQLAHESGGHFFLPEKQDQLCSEIKANEKIKPDKFVHFAHNELLNSKWLFIFIILAFGLEWFLRKYWGIY